jgi:O-antigen ligase
MNKYLRVIKTTLSLAILAFFLSEYVLSHESFILGQFFTKVLSLQWVLLALIMVWLGVLIILDFSIDDLPLVGLAAITVAFLLRSGAVRINLDAFVLIFGMTIGRTMRFLFRQKTLWKNEGPPQPDKIMSQTNFGPAAILFHPNSGAYYFVVGLILLLAIASCCQLHVPNPFYNGPRWMGIWDNPNEFGMLMGAGVVLAVGLLATPGHEEGKRKNWLTIILFIATGLMTVGLLFSFSRGAWLGSGIGLTYLAGTYRRLNWRYILPGILCVGGLVWILWNGTSESTPWYLKRMDLGRASAQHRVAAWRAGLEMMRDHPFGVGWNKSVEVYYANYSPPQGGAGAIATNDYLMLGTQLGVPGLLCFLVYVATCFRGSKSEVPHSKEEPQYDSQKGKPKPAAGSKIGGSGLDGSQLACRAGALSMLAAFWFDDGLFNLATAAVFWILLELGRAERSLIRKTFRPAPASHRREVTSAT